MEFGFGLLTAQNPPDADRSFETVYDETLRLARLAEEVGFDGVWTSEHHFWEDGYSPSVLPLSAALATATETVTVGTAIALGPLYDPIRFAEDAATVDLIANGRFVAGVANGYMPHEFRAFDVPLPERAARVEDLVAVCRRAWTGERFSYTGAVHQYEDLRITPPPAQPDGPPLLLGGTSEPAIARAGRIADGHVGFVPAGGSGTGGHGYTLDAAADAVTRAVLLEKFVDDVGTVAATSDRPREELTFVSLDSGFVGADDAAAWETVQEPTLYAGRQYASHYHEEPVTMDRSEAAMSLLRRNAPIGGPSTVIDRLRAYERVSPDWLEPHVIAMGYYPGLDFETHAAALERFGAEVLPAFD